MLGDRPLGWRKGTSVRVNATRLTLVLYALAMFVVWVDGITAFVYLLITLCFIHR